MSTCYWVGNAAAIAQVRTYTVADAGIGAADTWSITISDKVVTYTVVGDTTDDTVSEIAALVVDAIETAIATGNYPEFAEVSWSVNGAVITATGTPGVPFTATSATSGGGTFTAATVTACTGPNFADNAANWSGGAVPVTGDTVIIADSNIDILYNIDTAFPIASVQLAAFRIDASFTGKIGLPLINAGGYEEYRARYLKVGLDASLTIPIGWGPGQGSSRLYLDLQTAATTTVKVYATGQATDADEEPLRLLMVHAADVLEIASGSVGLAREPGQVSTVATVRLEAADGQDGNTSFRAGSGCTLATLIVNGGEVLTDCAITTVTLLAGTWTHTSGAMGTITNTAGTIVDQSTGTITAYTGRAGSVYDHRTDFRAKTFTAVDLYAGASWIDPNAAANTYTAGIDLNQCSLADVTIDIGPNRKITPAAVS